MSDILAEHDGGWSYSLTDDEKRHVARISRLTIGARGGQGADRGREILRRNIGGYAAEIAAARCLGHKTWLPVFLDRFRKTSDLPGGLEVRHAENDDYNLLVYGRDEGPIILVTGDPRRELACRGWINAHEGRLLGRARPDMKRDATHPDRVWLVSREVLEPMHRLTWR